MDRFIRVSFSPSACAANLCNGNRRGGRPTGEFGAVGKCDFGERYPALCAIGGGRPREVTSLRAGSLVSMEERDDGGDVGWHDCPKFFKGGSSTDGQHALSEPRGEVE